MRGAIISSFLLTIPTFLMHCFAMPAVETIPYLTPYVSPDLAPKDNIDDHKTTCQIDCEEGFSHDTLTICGTDGCTYSGPKQLVCIQSCGKKVDRKRDGNCSKLESRKAKACPRNN